MFTMEKVVIIKYTLQSDLIIGSRTHPIRPEKAVLGSENLMMVQPNPK